MEEELIKKTKEQIKQIIDDDINPNNVEHLYKLVDIYKDIKEVECMNYGNYGRSYGEYGRGSYGEYNGYGNYGNYGEYGRESYGARGRGRRYRGDDYMDRMSGEYGRYMENRERYGAGSQETDKSFHYMVKALEDFVMVLKEEAETPQQKQQLMEALQNSMR